MGAAACWYLAKGDYKVLGLEQFDIPHEQGSHAGQSRIIRKAYFEHSGYVPLLELDDGTRLREGPAIVQYIADQVPDKKLAPANGTMARYKLQEWLTFIGTEVHKGFSPLFNPATPDAYKVIAKDRLLQRLVWVDSELAGKQYLMGDNFSVADPYLFTVSNWTKPTNVDISGLANLGAFRARMAARPAVQAAMKAEGLM